MTILRQVSPAVDREPVIVVGGANREVLISVNEHIASGEKHEGDTVVLSGGSGLNHTMRLLSVGIPVLPILAVGDDDAGRRILDMIVSMAHNRGLYQQIGWFLEHLFVRGLSTPTSTILVDRKLGRRTAIKSKMEGLAAFPEHLRGRLDAIARRKTAVAAVMIGHVQADAVASTAASSCTGMVMDFAGDSPVFANFGRSQYQHGFAFWHDTIDRLAGFQLSLLELRALFGQDERTPLTRMMQRLSELQGAAIVTLDKFGAICTPGRRVSGEGAMPLIVAWPMTAPIVVDPTGAGDAFGAGFVATGLLGRRGLGQPDVGLDMSAIEQARLWAAFACTQSGGANGCPSLEELTAFAATLENELTCEARDLRDSAGLLRILDLAFPREAE